MFLLKTHGGNFISDLEGYERCFSVSGDEFADFEAVIFPTREEAIEKAKETMLSIEALAKGTDTFCNGKFRTTVEETPDGCLMALNIYGMGVNEIRYIAEVSKISLGAGDALGKFSGSRKRPWGKRPCGTERKEV